MPLFAFQWQVHALQTQATVPGTQTTNSEILFSVLVWQKYNVMLVHD